MPKYRYYALRKLFLSLLIIVLITVIAVRIFIIILRPVSQITAVISLFPDAVQAAV